MDIRLQITCEGIDWVSVADVIEKAGLGTRVAEQTQKSFEDSYARVFAFDGSKLVGTGRAISDGIYQSAIYDVTVLPEYQNNSIGKKIILELHRQLEGTNIILFANPTNPIAKNFYKKLGYCEMLTGMGKFKNEITAREKGFIK